MPMLIKRLAHACLCAAIALPSFLSTTALAGGNGSLFASSQQNFGSILEAAPVSQTDPLLQEPQALLPQAPVSQVLMSQTTPMSQDTPLFYSQIKPTRIKTFVDAPVEQFYLASASPRTSSSYSPRDLECMTEALYHEARGEGRVGQKAVAEVILNRKESNKFPSSICGVVNQPYQFSYTIGGAKPIRDKDAYQRAKAIAQEALSGAPRVLTGGATYFHTPAVHPSWARNFRRTVQIGQHIFYNVHQRRPQIIASN